MLSEHTTTPSPIYPPVVLQLSIHNKILLLRSLSSTLLLPLTLKRTSKTKIMAIGKQCKMTQAGGLKQILKRCSSLGRKQHENIDYNDVPKGHFAVYVGEHRSRYIIPISYLCQPEFQYLLQQAEEEFGFGYHTGLIIPCEEVVFQALTASLR